MGLTIILDTSPLGLVTKRKGITEADQCFQWVADCRRAGHAIIAPAIAYYEVARELERMGNSTGLLRLEAFCAVPGCYLSFSDAALRLAVKLWAQVRNSGTPTADPKELDCDVLIAAQALSLNFPPSDFVIATMNVGHLSQFAPAELWTNILP